jgi:hypothetical protein
MIEYPDKCPRCSKPWLLQSLSLGNVYSYERCYQCPSVYNDHSWIYGYQDQISVRTHNYHIIIFESGNCHVSLISGHNNYNKIILSFKYDPLEFICLTESNMDLLINELLIFS